MLRIVSQLQKMMYWNRGTFEVREILCYVHIKYVHRPRTDVVHISETGDNKNIKVIYKKEL